MFAVSMYMSQADFTKKPIKHQISTDTNKEMSTNLAFITIVNLSFALKRWAGLYLTVLVNQ